MTCNLKSILLSLLLVIFPFLSIAQNVPHDYKRFFKKYSQEANIFSEKISPLFGLQKVGRSFALIAGISEYKFDTLTPAKVDVDALTKYLIENEYFDEVVVLENDDVNYDTLSYFLQTYFKERLTNFPQSRFLFAYSGHGFKDGNEGYLVLSPAEKLRDFTHSLSAGILAQLIRRVTGAAHHTLVLLNACHSGALLSHAFGSETYLPRKRGAHAITASGTNEKAFAIDEVGPGSVFFELVLDGIRGAADYYPRGGDGIITTTELFTFLHAKSREVRSGQVPRQGDLRPRGDASEGNFFFLDDDEATINVGAVRDGDFTVRDVEREGITAMGEKTDEPVKIEYLVAEPPISVRGRSVKVKWASSNATRCVFNDREEIYPESGERTLPAITSATVSIRCSNGREEAGRSLDITVLKAPVIMEFSVSKGIIEKGASTTLSWKSSNAEECTLDNDIGGVAVEGSVMVRPRTTTSFNLFCSTQDVEKRARVDVAVCGAGEKVEGSRCVERCEPSQHWDGVRCEDECEADEKWVDGVCEERCEEGERWNGRRCVSKCGPNQTWDEFECVSQGWPRGTVIRPCGCWGPVNFGARDREPACASGLGEAVGCNLLCPAGGYQWAVRCY